MLVEQPRVPSPKELLPQCPLLILLLHQPPPLQHGNNALNEVCKRTRGNRVGQIEPVHPHVDPLLEGSCQLLRGSHKHRPPSTNPHEFRQIPQCPLAARILGESTHERADRVRLDVLQRLLRRELPKVDPSPAAEQRQGTLVADLLEELLVLPARRGLRVPGDRLDIHEEEHILRVSPVLARLLPRILDVPSHHVRVGPAHKHTLRVPSRELLPPRRSPRLVQYRRTLRGGSERWHPCTLKYFPS